MKLLVFTMAILCGTLLASSIEKRNLKSNNINTIEKRFYYPESVYTQQEKDAIVAKHNEYRQMELASNMQYMRWDDDLASMAQESAGRCNMDSGHLENTSPFSTIGQNIYVTSISVRDVTDPVRSWWKERHSYDYDTRKCSGVCKHYTQIVWDETTHVGCGTHKCTEADGGDVKSGEIVVCNYGPAGNARRQPYKKGDHCSECGSGMAWCKDNMCDDCLGEPDCTCEANCLNCGTKNTDVCSCACAPGWMGASCQDICMDLKSKCGNGWLKSDCGKEHVDRNCPAMCGLCEVNDNPEICDIW